MENRKKRTRTGEKRETRKQKAAAAEIWSPPEYKGALAPRRLENREVDDHFTSVLRHTRKCSYLCTGCCSGLGSTGSDGITNQLYCVKISPRWWRWMIPSLLPSFLFYPPPLQSPVLSPLIQILVSLLARPFCLSLVWSVQTHTAAAHPLCEFSSTPLLCLLAKIFPSSRSDI